MSKITEEDIKKIALLSRLELDEKEVGKFAGQLESILEYIEHLSEVDIEGVEPFISAAASGNVFREDRIIPSLPNEKALQNAPKSGEGFFKVPAVIK